MASSTTHRPHEFGKVMAMVARFVTYLIYLYLVFVVLFLGIGFFLLLFGANQSSGFVTFVYSSVQQAMEPFNGVFQQFPIQNQQEVSAVFDPSILLAMIIYTVIAILLHSLVVWLTNKVRQIEVEQRLSAQHAAYHEAANSYAAPLPDVMGDAKSMPAPEAGSAAPSGQVPDGGQPS